MVPNPFWSDVRDLPSTLPRSLLTTHKLTLFKPLLILIIRGDVGKNLRQYWRKNYQCWQKNYFDDFYYNINQGIISFPFKFFSEKARLISIMRLITSVKEVLVFFIFPSSENSYNLEARGTFEAFGKTVVICIPLLPFLIR